MRKAEESNISYSDIMVEDFSSITGKGIKGSVNGTTYYIGNPKLFKELQTVHFTPDQEQLVSSLQNQGKTAMIVGTEQNILAVIAVADEVRDSSKGVIQNYINLVLKPLCLRVTTKVRPRLSLGLSACRMYRPNCYLKIN